MPPYDMYPAVDQNYLFPPQVLQAIAKSSPIKDQFYSKSEIDSRLAAVLEPTDLDLENLNDLTEDGFYIQISTSKATPERNYPDRFAGMLEVTSRPGDFLVYQRYTTYTGGDVYWRAKYASTWYPWEDGVSAAELDAALSGKADANHTHTIGQVTGLGDALAEKMGIEAIELGADADANLLKTPGVYTESGGQHTATQKNFPIERAGVLIVRANASRSTVYQEYRPYGAVRSIYVRASYADTWYDWEELVLSSDPRLTNARTPTAHKHKAADITDLDGVIGARLEDISSAYDVAVSEGFSGSASEWLASLQGPQGVEGPYGGTEVTDPQVASYITSETETRDILDRKYSRSVSVKEFNAVGDGVADDTAALQATIDAASSAGLPVFVPGGRYRITSTLNIPSFTTIQGVGTASVIDIKGLGAAIGSGKTAMQASGSLGDEQYLAEEVVKGSKTLTLQSAAEDLSVGDYVILSSDDIFANSKALKRGEIKRVELANESTLTFEDSTYDTYTTNARVQKMAPVESISLFDLALEGTNVDNMERGLFITYGVDVRVSGCTFNYTDWNSINLRSVHNFKVTGNTFQNVKWIDNGPNYYGLVTENACSHGTFTGNKGTMCRHLFTTGYTVTIPGVSRFIVVEGNTDSYSQSASYDTHDGSEFITIKGNISSYSAFSGINMEGRESIIEGNQIIGFSTTGINIRANAEKIGCSNNRITTTVDAASSAITVAQTYDLHRPSHIQIHGNIVDGPMANAIYVRTCDSLSIANNDFLGFWESHLIRLHSAEKVRIIGNTGGSSEAGAFLYLQDSKNLVISNNDAGSAQFAVRDNETFEGGMDNTLIIGNDFTSLRDSRVFYNLKGYHKIVSNLGVADSVIE